LLRKVLAVLLIVVGIATIGLGVASGTIWRESEIVTAVAEPENDGTLLVTDPGVLGLVSAVVTIRATRADGGPVAMVMGRDVDVLGWIGPDHFTQIVGMQDWQTLETVAVAPEAAGQAGRGANPLGSDLWIRETSDDGSVTMLWDERPGRWSLLAAGTGADPEAPTLELIWRREVTTPWVWPGVFTGSFVLLVGLALLVFAVLSEGTKSRRVKVVEDSALFEVGNAFDERGAAIDQEQSQTPIFAPVGPGLAGITRPSAASEAIVQPPAAVIVTRTGSTPVVSPLPSRRALRATQDTDRHPESQAVPAVSQGVPIVSPPTEQVNAEGEVVTATGSIVLPTRRQLREAAEAAKRAQAPSISERVLGAITGAIPIVTKTPEAPISPTPENPPAPVEAAAVEGTSRSDAWRAAWGFDPSTGEAGSEGDK